MKKILAISSLILMLSACSYIGIEQEVTIPVELRGDITPPPSQYDLLTLDTTDPVCTEAPTTEMNAMTGAEEAIYPVHSEYTAAFDDKYQIKAVFTAAACGEGRMEELFGDAVWSDYRLFVSAEGARDLNLLKALDDAGFEQSTDGDDGTGVFHRSGEITAEDLLPLRAWADEILGTDCLQCG